MLAENDNALALAVLIMPQATVAAVFAEIGRFDISPKIPAVDGRNLPCPADVLRLHFRRHRFAEFMRHHESRFVSQLQIAGQGKRRLAFDLIAEDRYGREIIAERAFMGRKQRPACDAEIPSTALAAPPGRAIGAAAVIEGERAALGAYSLPIRLRPAYPLKQGFRLDIRQPKHLSEAQALGGAGE